MIGSIIIRYSCLFIQFNNYLRHQPGVFFYAQTMNYPIVNLLKLNDLELINNIFGTKYKRVKVQDSFEQQLQYHNMSEIEYRHYKRIMEQEPKGY